MNETANISRGWHDHRKGRYEQAITDFNLALQENPQSAHAYFGLAVAWEDKGDYDKAKEYYSKAIALDPRYAFLFYDVGSNKPESVYIRRGWRYYLHDASKPIIWWRAKFKPAIDAFNLALEKNPKSAEALIGLANVWEQEAHNYDNAIKYLSKAIEVEPKAGYFWLRGDVWSNKLVWWSAKKRYFEQAIEDYTSAINRDPTFAPAYTDRGACYISMGQYETALADYEKALELVPSNDQRPYAIQVRTVALGAISDLQKKLRKT